MSRVKVVAVKGLSNREFLERYAGPGRVGLACGTSWVDQRIRRTLRHLTPDGEWCAWSHAMLFEGRRADGQHWVFEADIEFARGFVQSGVQENRVEKFWDEKKYSGLAVLDFGLSPEQARLVMGRALDMTAQRVAYSYRGIMATWLAVHRKTLSRQSRLQNLKDTFCSSFVQRAYKDVGIAFSPGVEEAHTTPQHIAATVVPHTRYLLQR